jgi:serine/threonine protein kinase
MPATRDDLFNRFKTLGIEAMTRNHPPVFTVEEAGPWVRQMCEALAYAHESGRIVHRDLKPSNLMLDANGMVKVVDFGIASSIGDSMSRVSKADRVLSSGGTLPYMSPQQVMGYPPSVADDVYAIGATLYELLTSKPPFLCASKPHAWANSTRLLRRRRKCYSSAHGPLLYVTQKRLLLWRWALWNTSEPSSCATVGSKARSMRCWERRTHICNISVSRRRRQWLMA